MKIPYTLLRLSKHFEIRLLFKKHFVRGLRNSLVKPWLYFFFFAIPPAKLTLVTIGKSTCTNWSLSCSNIRGKSSVTQTVVNLQASELYIKLEQFWKNFFQTCFSRSRFWTRFKVSKGLRVVKTSTRKSL